MKTLVMIFHPQLTQSTSQNFFLDGLTNLTDVSVIKLTDPARFAEQRPQLIAELRTAKRVIWQFPLYWYSAPAIMHQWLEEQLTGEVKALFAKREVGVVVTLGKSERHYHLGAQENVTVDELIKPYATVARHLQAHFLPPLVIADLIHQPLTNQLKQLIAYQQYLTLAQPASLTARGKWLLAQLDQQFAAADVAVLHDFLAEQIDDYADLAATLQATKGEWGGTTMDDSQRQWVHQQLTQLQGQKLTVAQAALLQALQEYTDELASRQELAAGEIDGNSWSHRSNWKIILFKIIEINFRLAEL